MAKIQFENRAQLRLDLIDGQWRYAVYGLKQTAKETAGLTGKLATFFPTHLTTRLRPSRLNTTSPNNGH
jgi:hypothetical protein